MTTPESSLTNLIRDMKCEVARENLLKSAISRDQAQNQIEAITTLLETVDTVQYDKDLEHLMIEEETLEPVMCGNLNSGVLDCKTISPAPSNHDEFEIPEIYDDVISTIYSDPPVFDSK